VEGAGRLECKRRAITNAPGKGIRECWFTSATEPSTVSFTYDAVGRLAIKWDFDAGKIVYNTYNAAGRLVEVTDNSQRATDYAYNNMGWLTQVAVGGRNFNYSYDTIGRRTQLQYPNGMTANYAYDTRGRLTDIHYKDSGNVTLERSNTYDTASNITQVVDAANAKWNYAYDDRYRLTQAIYNATAKHHQQHCVHLQRASLTRLAYLSMSEVFLRNAIIGVMIFQT